MEHNIPRELILISYKDFLNRYKDVYESFWQYFVPFFDIGIYRDYLLKVAPLAENPDTQIKRAEQIWEYLMGDIQGYDIQKYRDNRRYYQK